LDSIRKYKLKLIFTDTAKKIIKRDLNVLNHDNKDLREEEIFSRLFIPNKNYLCTMQYLRKGSQGDKIFKIKLEKNNYEENVKILELLKSDLLIIEGIQKVNNEFLVTSIKSISDYNYYEKKAYEQEVLLSFYTEINAPHFNIGIEDNFMDNLHKIQENNKEFNTRIKVWKKYLNKNIEIAERKNFTIDYINYIDRLNNKIIEFTLSENLSEEQINKIQNAYNDRLYLYEQPTYEVNKNQEADGIIIGTIKKFNLRSKRLIVNMTDEIYDMFKQQDLRFKLKGSLQYKPVGSFVELNRKLKALRNLKKGFFANENLANFFFDIKNASINEKAQDKEIDFFNKSLNNSQKKAVKQIMHTNDISLIKGPPGTGKTTLITEACYQLAKDNKKVLIASQTNLAVDNVFAKLKEMIQQGAPIYPFRYGNISSFEKEGEDFTKENLVDTFLQSSAYLAKNRLEDKISQRKSIENINPKYKKVKELQNNIKEHLDFSYKYFNLIKIQDKLDDIRKAKYLLNLIKEHKNILGKINNKNQKIINLLEIQHKEKENLNKIYEEARLIDTQIKKLRYKEDQLKTLLFKINEVNFEWEENLKANVNIQLKDYNLKFIMNFLKTFEIKNVLSTQLNNKAINKIENRIDELFEDIEQYEELTYIKDNIIPFLDLSQEYIDKINEGYPALLDNIDITFKKSFHNKLLDNFIFENNILKPRQSSYIKINTDIKKILNEGNKKELLIQLKELKFRLEKSLTTIIEKEDSYHNFLENPLQNIKEIIIDELEKETDNMICKILEEIKQLEANKKELTNIMSQMEVEIIDNDEKLRLLKTEKVEAISVINKKYTSNEPPTNSTIFNLYNSFKNLMNDKLILINWDQLVQKTENEIKSLLKKDNILLEDIEEKINLNKKKKPVLESKIEKLMKQINITNDWWCDNLSELKYYGGESEYPNNQEIEKVIRGIEEKMKLYDEYEYYENRYSNIVNSWFKDVKNKKIEYSSLLEFYFKKINVLGVTCSKSAGRDFLTKHEEFDYVILDEVSKATPMELLMPILKGKKIILIGDDKQLPPLISREAIDELKDEDLIDKDELIYLERPLFNELWENADQKLKTMLNTQYRMHPQIMNVINQFYKDELISGIKNPNKNRDHQLEMSYLDKDQHVLWVDTPNYVDYYEKEVGTSYINQKEVEIIDLLLNRINKISQAKNNFNQKIGIITFYGAQENLIYEKFNNRYKNLHIRTGTVDRFQGMEREIIIVSMVRNNKDKNIGFARKPERINVALSRAKNLLILVGNAKLFCHSNFDEDSQKIYNRVAEKINITGGLIDVPAIKSK